MRDSTAPDDLQIILGSSLLFLLLLLKTAVSLCGLIKDLEKVQMRSTKLVISIKESKG